MQIKFDYSTSTMFNLINNKLQVGIEKGKKEEEKGFKILK